MIRYKIIVYAPLTHSEAVRNAFGKAGAGKMGNYSFCSFSSRGTGRFRPEKGARPAIGTVGKLEEVEEEKIEVVCDEKNLADVLREMKSAHPYEEVAYEVYKLEDY